MVLSGNASVSNFTTSFSFRIRKSIGRGYSSRSSQVFGSPSSSHLPSSTFLVFVPLLGYSYSHPYSSHPLSWHSTAFPPAVDLRSLYKNRPRLRPSSWPSLMPPWHTFRRPLTGVASIHRSILPSGTASSPGTAPVCRSILSLPSSGRYTSLIRRKFPLSGVHLSPLFLYFVDVTKGSPLLPACFFPFYFLRVYVYVRRIWLGHRREVRLVSYQRDLGVWMFLGVRRTGFLSTISLKIHAVFVP